MSGIDPRTGKFLEGWDHVVVCVGKLFSTRIGSRERRRLVGSFVPRLLGENLDEPTVFRYALAVAVAVGLWEPRFLITGVRTLRGPEQPTEMRQGHLTFSPYGLYRPRALLGDLTVAPGERTLFIGSSGVTNGVIVI